MTFGISSHLFQSQRLERAHVEAIGALGFEVLELVALRPHVDYRDHAALAELGDWLRAAGIRLHSVHAPLAEGSPGEPWDRAYSIGATDPVVRRFAVDETLAALDVALVLPYQHLVLHLDSSPPGTRPYTTNVDAVRRSLEELHPHAAAREVRLAFEVLDTPLSSPDALLRTIEQLELDDAGVCLDFGYAQAHGGVVDVAEEVSGSLWTTHVHDTAAGRRHLVPFDGEIDWGGALLSLQKVGYDGPWILELDGGAAPLDVLRRAAAARRRLEAALAS